MSEAEFSTGPEAFQDTGGAPEPASEMHPAQPHPVAQEDTEAEPQREPNIGAAGVDVSALPAGSWDTGLEDRMVGVMRELGMSGDQISGLVREYVSDHANQYSDFEADSQQARESGLRDLKNDWGKSFDAHVANAQRAFKLAGPQVQELSDLQLAGGGRLGDHPGIIKLFSAIGARMHAAGPTPAGVVPSAGAPAGEAGTFMSKAQARAAQEELAADPEFMRRWSSGEAPGHAAAVRRMNALSAVLADE